MPHSLDGLTPEEKVTRLHRLLLDLTLEVEGKPEKHIPGLVDRLKEVEQLAGRLEVQIREANLPRLKDMLTWWSDNIETMKSLPVTVTEFNRMRWTLYGILITLGLILSLSGANLGLQWLRAGGIP